MSSYLAPGGGEGRRCVSLRTAALLCSAHLSFFHHGCGTFPTTKARMRPASAWRGPLLPFTRVRPTTICAGPSVNNAVGYGSASYMYARMRCARTTIIATTNAAHVRIDQLACFLFFFGLESWPVNQELSVSLNPSNLPRPSPRLSRFRAVVSDWGGRPGRWHTWLESEKALPTLASGC